MDTAMVPSETPEKAARQLLSCNQCRKRKVKCDRVSPCEACCLRNIPDQCEFQLTESARKPVLQAVELRQSRAENVRLKERLRKFLSEKQVEFDERESEEALFSENGLRRAPKVPSKPAGLRQRKFMNAEPTDNLYFGSPGLASVINDFASLNISPQGASLTHTAARGADMYAWQDGPAYPFATMWNQNAGAVALLDALPSNEEIFCYLEAFQRRAQSCSFPHTPEECTVAEVKRFLSNKEHNAFVHPDMLALLFATLAQGLQNGVYDHYGGQWVKGAMETELLKGDVYIAAAMQALRVATFMSRPTLLAIETLIMIGPYLTNSGKFLDAWTLFGVTIRLAHSIGLHRNPSRLDPAPPLKESAVRQALWWWMLHMDQQYSMTLGRPLGISGIGDCPPPEPLTTDPTIMRLFTYISQFTVLARQILSSDVLTNAKIDAFTDKLLRLKDTLPDVLQFDETWLDVNKSIPEWPLEAQAAVFYGKTQNFLVLLNRQRIENSRRHSNDSALSVQSVGDRSTDPDNVPRGRERVLESCRGLLNCFKFFHTRVRCALLCWTVCGHQAFTAATILTLAMMESSDDKDLALVHSAYDIFVEMKEKGIHKLASLAVDKLKCLMEGLNTRQSPTGGVMGATGMLLLEDPGLQGFKPDEFAPLQFRMAGGDIPLTNVGTGWAAQGAGTGPSIERGQGNRGRPPLPRKSPNLNYFPR